MTQWRRLYGDTDRFAIEIGFETDPDASHVPPLLASSWGSLQLWAGGRPLCAHQSAGETREKVFWYLLPLIEWFVDCWDPLLHEQTPPEPPNRSDGWSMLDSFSPVGDLDDRALDLIAAWQRWSQRHALRTARRGGLFPDLVIRRRRHRVEISWGDRGLAGRPAGHHFLESRGSVDLAPERVAEPLHQALTESLEFLRSQATTDQVPEELVELSQRTAALAQPGRESPRLALLAGLHEQTWTDLRTRIEGLAADAAASLFPTDPSRLVAAGSCHAALMFGSLSPELSTDDKLHVAQAMIGAWEPNRAEQPVDALAETEPPPSRDPWRDGYQRAEELLETLGYSSEDTTSLEIEALTQSLGIEIASLQMHDVKTRGAAFVSSDHRPTILLNEKHPANRSSAGRRFSIAHELCHLLFDRGTGRSVSMASGPWTEPTVEQRANTFAAMLLMPAPAATRVARRAQTPRDAVSAVAQTFGVGQRSALDHLMNLGVIDREERDQLIDQSLGSGIAAA